MIIGINGSGRKSGETLKAIKTILNETKEEYEIISLSDKKITGCIGCTACAKDNKCVLNDDFNNIVDKLIKADAIVFGAPSYYGGLNGISRCFLERLFVLRHNEKFSLAGKLCIIVGTGYDDKNIESVHNQVEMFMNSNYIKVIDKVSVKGYSQCYTCGYGQTCAVGNVVKDHGYIDVIEDKHLPKCFEDQNDSVFSAKKAGKILGNILTNRNNL